MAGKDKSKIQNKAPEKEEFMHGDALRLLFLTLLYSVQGFAIGFLYVTMPIILKKYFSYSEVGIISWCSFPYTIKFIFAPFIDTYFVKRFGKKRSWIVPTQVALIIVNFYASFHITQLIDERRYVIITLVFAAVILL